MKLAVIKAGEKNRDLYLILLLYPRKWANVEWIRHRCAHYFKRQVVTKYYICDITCQRSASRDILRNGCRWSIFAVIESDNIKVYLSFNKPFQRNGQKLLSEHYFKWQEMAYAGWCRNFLPFVIDFLFHSNKIPSDLFHCLTFKC